MSAIALFRYFHSVGTNGNEVIFEKTDCDNRFEYANKLFLCQDHLDRVF